MSSRTGSVGMNELALPFAELLGHDTNVCVGDIGEARLCKSENFRGARRNSERRSFLVRELTEPHQEGTRLVTAAKRGPEPSKGPIAVSIPEAHLSNFNNLLGAANSATSDATISSGLFTPHGPRFTTCV